MFFGEFILLFVYFAKEAFKIYKRKKLIRIEEEKF
jgi:hypothetical protein